MVCRLRLPSRGIRPIRYPSYLTLVAAQWQGFERIGYYVDPCMQLSEMRAHGSARTGAVAISAGPADLPLPCEAFDQIQWSRSSVLLASSTNKMPLPPGATTSPNRAPDPGGLPVVSTNRCATCVPPGVVSTR